MALNAPRKTKTGIIYHDAWDNKFPGSSKLSPNYRTSHNPYLLLALEKASITFHLMVLVRHIVHQSPSYWPCPSTAPGAGGGHEEERSYEGGKITQGLS